MPALNLKGKTYVATLSRADNALGVRVRAKNLCLLQWAVDAHRAEPGTFSLLGTFYGGNGTTNFQLPDLRSRTPVGSNAGSDIGQPGGVESVVLNVSQMPAHNHSFNGTTGPASTRIPAGNVLLGATGTQNVYGPSGGTPVALAPLDPAGQSAAHSNMQPYLAINFCIALQGVFPSRS